VWLVVSALSAVRHHGRVLRCFLAGYAVTFGAILALAHRGLGAMLAGFALGQGTLLIAALATFARAYPGAEGVRFEFLGKGRRYLDLACVGLLFNLGVWVDKVLFWFDPITGQRVLGPLHASEVYDLPLFLAYLSIVPGMAVFLIRVETDFAQAHHAFYGAIEGGAPLRVFEPLRDAMVVAVRRCIGDIYRVQGLTVALCFVAGPGLLSWFGIPRLHVPLFLADATAVGFQVVLLAVISVLFYLDRRGTVLWLCALLVISNVACTWLSHRLGPAYYGCGFAAAVALTSLLGLWALTRAFATLVRDTFMLQRVAV